ncbi:hypothetical protein UPYG_G00238050 [Umbra pygmaea]|uniref:Integrase catalytic domain-containing protein n=1 Tax=Umbra pygmaea TaxID=75934 RepID=A0ABD0WEP9_UMBPY
MYPNSGFRIVLGHLHAQGVRVQDARVLESLRRVDPEGTRSRARSLCTIKRRQYSVPGPNAMWHIDGNHKLIRWRFVVHGGIDGFSRMITFLTAATNNRATTVLGSFLGAINRFGLPSRVRSDMGGENIEVAQFMVINRGEGRQSHITGIERLWRDVYQYVLDQFHHLFYNLEAEGLLNPDDEVHLYALHWSFLPQLQRHLAFFQEGWNNHKLRTANNQSPLQLWTTFGELEDTYQVDENYGVDGLMSNDAEGVYEAEGVHVPEVQLQQELTDEQIATLPNPNVPYSDAAAIYLGTVQKIMVIMG